MTIGVSFTVTAEHRRAVSRFLGHTGLATRDELRAYLRLHGMWGLTQQLALALPDEPGTERTGHASAGRRRPSRVD